MTVEGFDSILLRVEPEEHPAENTSRCVALCGNGERTSNPIGLLNGDTLIGYHSGRGNPKMGACAYVLLLWRGTEAAPVVVESCSMQAPVQDNNEGLSLLMLMRACIGLG